MYLHLWQSEIESELIKFLRALRRFGLDIGYSGAKKYLAEVVPVKKMREACSFNHSYTSTKNPGNHFVRFLKTLFV